MILGMRFLPKFGCSKGLSDGDGAAVAPETTVLSEGSVECAGADEPHLLRTVGWVSAALGAVALGLLVGRELRQRYKFNRRTPYDLYAHSGDELPDVDFGVGI
jgi:hypothetical protein